MKPFPFIASVIMPTSGRARFVSTALTSLISQDLSPEKFEIVVVENGGRDTTESIVSALIPKHPSHTIRYIHEPVDGLLAGRHRGAHEARSDILVFIDDDIEASPEWLSSICETFTDPQIQIVGGKSLPRYGKKPPNWVSELWSAIDEGRYCGYYSLIDLGDTMRPIDPALVWGLNFSIRRSTFYALGGFNPDNVPKHLQRFQGDGESGILLPAKAQKALTVYQPNALVYHTIPESRLTVRYLEERMFYQGVCDSYSSIRSQGKCSPSGKKHSLQNKSTNGHGNNKNPLYYFKTIRRVTKRMLRTIYRGYDIDTIRRRMAQAYDAGYDFHQKEVINDPSLLTWVLKENYFDYSYPALP